MRHLYSMVITIWSLTIVTKAQRIVTVMGRALESGGVASEEMVDRVRTAARVMGEVSNEQLILIGQ